MTKLLATRGAQKVMCAEFVFNYNDWATDSVDGTKKTFGSTVALADPSSAVSGLTAGTGIILDAINMPLGAVVVGGEVICETAYVGTGAGSTIKVGISGSDATLLASTDLDAMTAGLRTALLLTTPLTCNGGTNVRITTAGLTATATAGKVRVRVLYTVDGKMDEVVSS
jgi:hypothetical protein